MLRFCFRDDFLQNKIFQRPTDGVFHNPVQEISFLKRKDALNGLPEDVHHVDREVILRVEGFLVSVYQFGRGKQHPRNNTNAQ